MSHRVTVGGGPAQGPVSSPKAGGRALLHGRAAQAWREWGGRGRWCDLTAGQGVQHPRTACLWLRGGSEFKALKEGEINEGFIKSSSWVLCSGGCVIQSHLQSACGLWWVDRGVC